MEKFNGFSTSRRRFLCQIGHLAIGAAGTKALSACTQPAPAFTVSLATYSLHRTVAAGHLSNLDIPKVARTEFDIGVLEHLNGFFMDKAEDTRYLNALMQRCADYGVKNHLIMCDNEGALGEPVDSMRKNAVYNHHKWVVAAQRLGCASIRVNVFGNGTATEVLTAAIDGLGRLGEFAASAGINVLVENHGGYTSNAAWLASLLTEVNMPNVGALPDFGNFCLDGEYYDQQSNTWGCEVAYDRYQGIAELMPHAKGVSAKSCDFDEAGNCIETDFVRAMRIVKESGYRGPIGIEYEGANLGEYEGILKTKALLDRITMQG